MPQKGKVWMLLGYRSYVPCLGTQKTFMVCLSPKTCDSGFWAAFTNCLITSAWLLLPPFQLPHPGIITLIVPGCFLNVYVFPPPFWDWEDEVFCKLVSSSEAHRGNSFPDPSHTLSSSPECTITSSQADSHPQSDKEWKPSPGMSFSAVMHLLNFKDRTNVFSFQVS